MEKEQIHLGSVETDIENQIATITFFHPSHNSLPGILLAKLRDSIQAADQDESVTLIVLQSAGDRTFCAGASFDELIAIDNFENGKEFFMGFANVINACRQCSKLIIGRVQGKTVGGGVGLAAAVDFCLATKYASIRLSELAVGIGPFVVGPAVERKVGVSAFSQLAIDAGTWQSAEWAKEKGLFTQVFDSATEMDSYLNEFTTHLKTMNPDAMKGLKKIFWEDCQDWNELLEKRAEMSGQLILSDYAKNAINKFKNA